jgi:hypothetical protein
MKHTVCVYVTADKAQQPVNCPGILTVLTFSREHPTIKQTRIYGTYYMWLHPTVSLVIGIFYVSGLP